MKLASQHPQPGDAITRIVSIKVEPFLLIDFNRLEIELLRLFQPE